LGTEANIGRFQKVWSEEALKKTLRAAKSAFGKSVLPTVRNFSTCPEPEGLAVYAAGSGSVADVVEVIEPNPQLRIPI
jgi:hypothetical protein